MSGVATTGVLKEFDVFIFIILIRTASAVPAKKFRAHMRMCYSAKSPLAPPPGNRFSTAKSIMALNAKKKRCHCNICDIGFDFQSKLLRHFASSRHKLLEERYPALMTAVPPIWAPVRNIRRRTSQQHASAPNERRYRKNDYF